MNQLPIEDKAREVLSGADSRLVAAMLFGSFARETASETSDVDIAVLLRSVPPCHLQDFRFMLEGSLERALGRRVQVVILNQAPPDLVQRVLRDGRVLVDRDRSARIQFEVRARNEYFDLLPILDRYRRRPAETP